MKLSSSISLAESVFVNDMSISFATTDGVFITRQFIDRYPESVDNVPLPVFTKYVVSLNPSSLGGETAVIAKADSGSDNVEAWVLSRSS